MMVRRHSSTDRCEICGREAIATCRICGRRVCELHYDKETGLCSICRESLCSLCKERLAITTCSICGRLICRECSVEVEPGIRVCRECLAKYGGTKHSLKRLLRRPLGMAAASRIALRVIQPPKGRS